MNNGIRILTEDEFNKLSLNIKRYVHMSDIAYYFSNKNVTMTCGPYLLETGSVPKIVKNDGTLPEFNGIKMGQKFAANLQGEVVSVLNYNFELLKKVGIRPVIPLSMIPESIADDTTKHFSYGYYPTNILTQIMQPLVVNMFNTSSYKNLCSIKLDGKSYSVIEVGELYGEKFINLLEHNQKYDKEDFLFVQKNNIKYMWADLKRIEWTIDRNLGLAIADSIPMAGIDFNDTFPYKSFKDTKLYKWLNGEFLDTIMANEDEKLIIPKKNNDIFAIDLSNFSFTDIDTQKNNRKKELGIDSESIEEFRKKIKTVTEEDAERLGKELYNRVFKRSYNDENYDEVLKLIMDGANVNYRDTKNKLCFPLVICAWCNYLNTLIILVKAGANLNMVTDLGMSSVIAATVWGNKEILEILILMGADVNIKDYDGNTALSLSTLSSKREITKMLVEVGTYLNSTNLKGQNIFQYKQKEDNFGANDLFLEAIATLDDINNDEVVPKKIIKKN